MVVNVKDVSNPAERYTPGVGNCKREDLIKREVIHLLCKGPSTFSDLEKRLSEDPNEKTGLESVIKKVANFRLGKLR